MEDELARRAVGTGAGLKFDESLDLVSCQTSSSEGDDGILMRDRSEPASDMLSSADAMEWLRVERVVTVTEGTRPLCAVEPAAAGIMTAEEAIDSSAALLESASATLILHSMSVSRESTISEKKLTRSKGCYQTAHH